MASSWRETLSYLTPNSTSHVVQGQTLQFFPVSVGQAFRLRTMAKPLAGALSTLFTNTNHDAGTVNRKVGEDSEFIIEPVKPELAKLREEQRRNAIETLIAAATDEEGLKVIGDLVMDSLREIFPPEKKNERPPAIEFMNATPAPALAEMLVGVAKANKGVFGPLAGKMDSVLSKAGKSIEEKIAQAMDEANETPGSSSRTSSPGSSSEAMASSTS